MAKFNFMKMLADKKASKGSSKKSAIAPSEEVSEKFKKSLSFKKGK